MKLKPPGLARIEPLKECERWKDKRDLRQHYVGCVDTNDYEFPVVLPTDIIAYKRKPVSKRRLLQDLSF